MTAPSISKAVAKAFLYVATLAVGSYFYWWIAACMIVVPAEITGCIDFCGVRDDPASVAVMKAEFTMALVLYGSALFFGTRAVFAKKT